MAKDVVVARTKVVAGNSASMLGELIRAFGHFPEVISVADLQVIADRLTEVAGKEKGWTWRYLRSVLSGTVEPSAKLVDAMMRLGALVDGAPKESVMGERVTVLALGQVEAGAVVLASSKRCANPACKVVFVPVVPWQKCHSKSCAKAVRDVRRMSGGGA